MKSDYPNVYFDCRYNKYSLEEVDLSYQVERVGPTNCIKIFTDGSEFNNRTCLSFIVYDKNAEIFYNTYRLNNKSTVFMAELTAIQNAVDYCNMNLVNRDVPILNDSLSALISIVS